MSFVACKTSYLTDCTRSSCTKHQQKKKKAPFKNVSPPAGWNLLTQPDDRSPHPQRRRFWRQVNVQVLCSDTHLHTRAHTHTHVPAYTHTHTRVHTYTDAYTRVHAHAQTHARTHTRKFLNPQHHAPYVREKKKNFPFFFFSFLDIFFSSSFSLSLYNYNFFPFSFFLLLSPEPSEHPPFTCGTRGRCIWC